MSKQTDINAKMRSILIDWLVEVHLKFKLMPETLYLTVNLIDRFLEKEQMHAQQAAACRRHRHVHRLQVRGDLRARVPRLRVHLG